MADVIVGIDAASYTPITADVGASLYCRVTATNAAGSAAANSNGVGPVTAAGGAPYVFLAATPPAFSLSAFTTAAIDTTGAGLLIFVLSDAGGSSPVLDSKGNTWALAASLGNAVIWYSRPTTVGTGHTATVNAGGGSVATFMAFSGGIASPFDVSSVNSGSGSPATPGSITPAQANELLIVAMAHNDVLGAATVTIGSGFTTVAEANGDGATHMGHACGRLVQGAAAAINPTVALTGLTSWHCAIASFKST